MVIPKEAFLSDVDGVVADLIGGLRKWMNHRFGFDFDVDEIVYHSKMGRSPKLADLNEELLRWFPGDADGDNQGFGGAFVSFMNDPHVYTRWVSPIPGAVEAMKELRGRYHVMFVTAMMKREARDHYRDKMEWIERWFPDSPISTVPSQDKHRVAGKFAVDDRYDTCRRWMDEGNISRDVFLFKQPWNEIEPGSGWHGMDWEQILEAVEEDERA